MKSLTWINNRLNSIKKSVIYFFQHLSVDVCFSQIVLAYNDACVIILLSKIPGFSWDLSHDNALSTVGALEAEKMEDSRSKDF